MEYLDFDVELTHEAGRDYHVIVRSPAGEASAQMLFPYDEVALELALVKLQNALLRSGGPARRALTNDEKAVYEFGRTLFEALMTGEVRSRYAVSRAKADQEEKGLRVRLHIEAPELAALPWEYLYDQGEKEFLCLSRATPLVRYLNLPRSRETLTIAPPLRILGLVASPDHPSVARLDTEVEQHRLKQALSGLIKGGLVELHWLEGHTWRDLQQAMWPGHGAWHILHFIGHGGFNEQSEEGMLALETDEGGLHLLSATHLGRVLRDHRALRLVLLNACEGARGSKLDRFSSVGATLARAGIPAVLAMQYEITDRAAVELTHTFYEALAGGLSVDAALTEARLAINIGVSNSLEWGTPVLFLRTQDSMLFRLEGVPPPLVETPPELQAMIMCPYCLTMQEPQQTNLCHNADCGRNLSPRYVEYARKENITIMGTFGLPLHGKTALLSSLMEAAQNVHKIVPGSYISPLGDETKRALNVWRARFSSGDVNLPSTTPMERPLPLLVQNHKFLTTRSSILVAYDLAGEAMVNAGSNPEMVRALSKVNTIWCVVSLDDLINKEEGGYNLVGLFYTYLEAMTLLQIPIQGKNILVVYTKADILLGINEGLEPLPEEIIDYLGTDPYSQIRTKRGAELPPFEEDTYFTGMRNVSDILREYTVDFVPGGGAFVNMVEQEGAHVFFTINSAFGGTPLGTSNTRMRFAVQSFRVLDTLIWALKLNSDK